MKLEYLIALKTADAERLAVQMHWTTLVRENPLRPVNALGSVYNRVRINGLQLLKPAFAVRPPDYRLAWPTNGELAQCFPSSRQSMPRS